MTFLSSSTTRTNFFFGFYLYFYPVDLLKRNAALDAANAAQSGITALVCKLSYQTKSAAYALG